MSTKRKIRVAVIMGGPSAERAISLQSGKAMAEHLDPEKYEILPVVIDTKRRWLPAPKLLKTGQIETTAITPSSEAKHRPFDVALLALHSFGEDGTVQGFLETLGIPYTGPGILASALAMDKSRFKMFIRSLGIPTPRGVLIEKDSWLHRRREILHAIRKLSSRVIVKPNASGSSIATAIAIARDSMALTNAINAALKIGASALVEEYVRGDELTVATLGDEHQVRAFPVIQIIPTKDTFFSAKVKYTGSTKELCPAPIPASLARTVSELALQVHVGIGASGLIRTDFMVRAGQPYVLETNTLPGMTPESLVPKAAKAAGLSFQQLLDELIRIALRRRHA